MKKILAGAAVRISGRSGRSRGAKRAARRRSQQLPRRKRLLPPIATWSGQPDGGLIRVDSSCSGEIAERGQFFSAGRRWCALFLLGPALVLLFTCMIIGPVKGH